MQALSKPPGKKISLPYGLSFTIDYDRYILSTEPDALSPFPPLDQEYDIKVPGQTIIPGWQIQAAIIKPDVSTAGDDNYAAYLDYHRVGNQLTVRSRRRGDRFQPLGMKEMKKIGQFMIDAGIPRDWRNRIPVIDSPDKILWVTGYRIDERVKVTPETTSDFTSEICTE